MVTMLALFASATFCAFGISTLLGGMSIGEAVAHYYAINTLFSSAILCSFKPRMSKGPG